MTELTEAEKRYITEDVLEKPYHDVEEKRHHEYLPTSYVFYCDDCQTHFPLEEYDKHTNRTLTTHADLADVYGKLVESGEWDAFAGYCYEKRGEKGMPCWDDDAWLFCLAHPEQIVERMRMVYQFKKERERCAVIFVKAKNLNL